MSSGEEPLTVVGCPVFPHQDYPSPLFLVISADVSSVEQEMVSLSIQESNCWLPDIIKRYTEHTASGSSSTPSSSLSHDLDWGNPQVSTFLTWNSYVILSQKANLLYIQRRLPLSGEPTQTVKVLKFHTTLSIWKIKLYQIPFLRPYAIFFLNFSNQECISSTLSCIN